MKKRFAYFSDSYLEVSKKYQYPTPGMSFDTFLLLQCLGFIGLHCDSVHIHDSKMPCLLLSEPIDMLVHN